MKDTAKLFAYFAAVLLAAALASPWIYSASHDLSPVLAKFDFETFLHRILVIFAVLFAGLLARSLGFRSRDDLHLARNRHALRDLMVGFVLAGVPLALAGAVLLVTNHYSIKSALPWGSLLPVAVATIIVPIIEEALFRGLLLGLFLRNFGSVAAAMVTSFIFATVHFLKTPANAENPVNWASGLHSLARAFGQFANPMLVLASFITLLLVGLILADARIRTRSLWLPIGLHAGWILASGTFSKFTRRTGDFLPWIGGNLLVGIIPLLLGLLTWMLLRLWLRNAERAV